MNTGLPISSIQGRRNPAARRLLAAATAAALVLTFIPGADLLTYPIRLFATLIHEGCHALMVELTGGDVIRMAIMPNGNGLTEYRSWTGWIAFINMAGYIGTTLFGAVCLHFGRGSKGKASLILLSLVALGITLAWLRPWTDLFGFGVGLGIAALLILAAVLLSESAALFLASFLSVQLSLNALYGLRDLWFLTTRGIGENDAVFMARQFGLTPWFWAALWAIISIVILGASLRVYWREGARNGVAA